MRGATPLRASGARLCATDCVLVCYTYSEKHEVFVPWGFNRQLGLVVKCKEVDKAKPIHLTVGDEKAKGALDQ